MKVEREQLSRDFRRNTLQKPDLTMSDFGDKKAYYDFSTRPIDEKFGAQVGGETKMTTEKPSHLENLVKDPPKFMIQDMQGGQQQQPQRAQAPSP